MKKHPLLLVLSLFALTGCSIVEPEPEASREEDIVLEEDSSENAEQSSGESKETKKEIKTVSDLTADEYKSFPVYYLKKLNSFASYKAVTEGKTTPSFTIGSLGVQSIASTAIKTSDYQYYYTDSDGTVHSQHTCYYHNDQAVYKNVDETEFTVKSMKEYLGLYGTYPFANAIEGFNVKADNILKVQKKDSTENHVFYLKLSHKEAASNVKIQMKEFGGLKNQPSFSNIELTITVKEDFTPITIDLKSTYYAELKSGLGSTCNQTYTVTFSNINEEIEIPGLDAVKNKFSA